MNLEPNTTTMSGLCAVNSSELTLVSGTLKIVFTFANVSPNQTICHFFFFGNVTDWCGLVFRLGERCCYLSDWLLHVASDIKLYNSRLRILQTNKKNQRPARHVYFA